MQPHPQGRAPAGGRRTAVVREVMRPHPMAVVLRLEVPDRVDHLPGQHYVVRLTAPDGYVAQRSYSIVSAPDDALLELFIERLDEGEVSTFLADVVEPGDELHIQGPIVEKILHEAGEQQADMIVIGSHGHGALYDLLVGTVTQGVIKSATCPVVVVPAPAKKD